MSRLRVGFLGVGWIGRDRMEAILATHKAEAVAICDVALESCDAARQLAPRAQVVTDLDAMLALDLDSIVIATPSALHAEQAIQCLEARKAVFCQKPLGRDADEVARVVGAAHANNRLLMGDFSYRQTHAIREMTREIRAGSIGRIYAVELVFHNAYGPDKHWFYDRAQAGGGCLIDLGSHLVDLVHWMLGVNEPASAVSATLMARGRSLADDPIAVEDYATASFVLGNGIAVRLACSWRLHAGQDAVIGISFYADKGGVQLRNLGGSFYDFEALLFRRTESSLLAKPPDAWGGRTAAIWVDQAAGSLAFRTDAHAYVTAAQSLDGIYRAGRSPCLDA